MSRIDRTGQPIRLPNNTPHPAAEVALPAVSRDLILYLEQQFPDRLPTVGASYALLERAWGAREVVEHLIEVHKQIEKNPIPNVYA